MNMKAVIHSILLASLMEERSSFIDGSDDGKKRELERVKELGIPQGTLEGMDRRHPGVPENGAERHLTN